MNLVLWFNKGRCVGDSRIPSIPRKGDMVCLENIYFVVSEVTWIFDDGINNAYVRIDIDGAYSL